MRVVDPNELRSVEQLWRRSSPIKVRGGYRNKCRRFRLYRRSFVQGKGWVPTTDTDFGYIWQLRCRGCTQGRGFRVTKEKRWRPGMFQRATCADCLRSKKRERLQAWREKHRQPTPERSCAHCGEQFTPKRSDARYCGATCRQRAHRSGARE